MAEYVDITGLRNFKTKQDAANLTKFASLSGGKVTAEQLPSYVDDVVEGYAKESGGVIGFYEDSDCTVAMTGETGKIYLDLAATIDGSYRYGGSQFVPIGNSVSTADKAIRDSDGNTITETYATKDALSAATTPATASSLGVVQIGENLNVDTDGTVTVATATNSALGLAQAGTNIDVNNGIFSIATGGTSALGVLQVGNNISVDGNGVISLDTANITNALGYTPVDSSEITIASTSAIDALFD